MAESPFTIFMLLRTRPDWLALPPADRFAFLDAEIRPRIARRPEVRLRFFDAEAFHAPVSDIAVWETADLRAWSALVEDLRETAFWGRYFEVEAILPSVESGWAAHYGQKRLGEG